MLKYCIGKDMLVAYSLFPKLTKRRGLHYKAVILLGNSPMHCRCKRNYAVLHNDGKNKTLKLLTPTPLVPLSHRNIAVLAGIVRAASNVLKLRYLLLGGALGGSYKLKQTFDSWKDAIPDTSWVSQLFPSKEAFGSFRTSLIDFKNSVSDQMKDIDLVDPEWKKFGDDKYKDLKAWFNQRLDDAISASQMQDEISEDDKGFLFDGVIDNLTRLSKLNVVEHVMKDDSKLSFQNLKQKIGFADSERKKQLEDRVNELEEELMNVQLKYQREIEKLEKDNKNLKKQLLLKLNESVARKKIKKSLIDMYSEVLDELSDYDSNYNTQDHLPRVVVVGDQSSGKTSVLEMIAQARIFPRGAGEMMTRAPVKVTLSEGPYHIASFKDSAREFDLSNEVELAELRKEVELRMINSVKGGKTVSQDVISMTVKGPGIQRMVLVDLPGIISTVTTEMASNTRDAIREISQTYMANPNAIILCIQDGSVDAERSNVTDLVATMDPLGKRTIFVLTKVDLAESTVTNPERIQKILQGKLFPMKALGYFAVVTGKGKADDSIQSIKDYEETFFKSSKMFRSNIVKSSQLTTKNLSLAISERFWKMVRETVEQQADTFKATRFNLETEWKNNFPGVRELDRDELFEKARGDILDEVVNLSQLSAKEWESVLVEKLWRKIASYVFESIYVPASQFDHQGQFNTEVDIKLKNWADEQLPNKCVEVGWDTLQFVFKDLIEKSKQKKNHDNLFDKLKDAVITEAVKRHAWEKKAADSLRVIQLNTLEDSLVSEKYQWDEALKLLENVLQEKLQTASSELTAVVGPSFYERWTGWKSSTTEQSLRSGIKTELEKILASDKKHTNILSVDEVTTVRGNLANQGTEVDNHLIKDTWRLVYRKSFLKKNLDKCFDCKKGFYYYRQGVQSELDCNDVVLFWRIQQTIRVTCNALRQQIMNREARRLEKAVKEVLEDFSQDKQIKEEFLLGKRVTLAEELKKVRLIQEKLEEFIKSLNKEKSY